MLALLVLAQAGFSDCHAGIVQVSCSPLEPIVAHYVDRECLIVRLVGQLWPDLGVCIHSRTCLHHGVFYYMYISVVCVSTITRFFCLYWF
jgi:hypothetical protein